MRRDEREYAIDRLRTIYHAKVEKLAAPEEKKLSHHEKVTLLRTGRVKVGTRVGRWDTDIDEVFDWKPFELPKTRDVHKTKRERVEREYQRIKDEMMLGDSAKALEAIRAFEKF